ncbi:CBS domain-containing protein [Kaarinaea lacus]
MTRNYRILPHHTIARTAKLNRRDQKRRNIVSMTNSAVDVMTDLAEAAPFSISATASIDEANDRMITYGVRLLFVSDGRGNLVGLITASDILGEKPMQHIAEHGGKRDDIITQDIMTAAENIDVLDIADVETASVGDIVETIKDTRRQHLLVVEPTADDSKEVLRGIFSTSQIARQLGIEIDLTDQASTFAEFEKALAAS